MDKFWLVWCMSKGVPTVKHASMSIAVKEAERLAEKHPGHDFYVMESRAVSKAKNVETEYLDETGTIDIASEELRIKNLRKIEELKKHIPSEHNENIKMP